jgi:RHS repeat-associated protein
MGEITVKNIIKLRLLYIPLLFCLFTHGINTNVYASKLSGGIERLEDGIEDYKNGKYDDAIFKLEMAKIQISEDDKESLWKAHLYLGSSYLLTGDEKEAINEYINAKKTIENRSPDPNIHHARIVELFNTANTSVTLEDPPEVPAETSSKVPDKMHAKRVGGGIDRLNDGIEDYNNGKYHDAIFKLEMAKIQIPEDDKEGLWKAHFYSGSSYLLTEDDEEAKKEFSLAQALLQNRSPDPAVHPERIVTLYNSMSGTAAAETGDRLTWRRGFDDQGRLAKLIDPAGRETRFDYASTQDNSFRLTKTPPEGARVVWDFNKRGRLANMSDSAGAVSYGYDDFGRINLIKRANGAAIAYTHDTQDRIISLKIGDFYELNYTYDFLGRIASINTPAGAITYEYLTGQGLLVRTLPNGVQTIWESDAKGQLRKIAHAIPVGGNNARILAEYRYEYRADSLISTISERSTKGEFVTVYKYDKTGRLIDATESSGQQYGYKYDQAGNRLSASTPDGSPQVCSYDWAGRLTGVNDNECTHDASGNLTSITIDDTAMKYRYNPDGQLQEVNGKISYRYDGDGKLIRRKSGKEETTYIPDPLSEYWQPLVIDNNSNGRTLVVWDGNAPLIMIQNGKPEYMLHDHLDSVRLVVDDKGEVTRHIDYDPFGVMKDPASAADFAPRYAGLFWDAQAQAYLTPSRAYEPTTGCFMGPDPQLRIPSDSKHNHSLYAYCGGDPVNFVDHNGAVAQRSMLTDGTGNASSGLSMPLVRQEGWWHDHLNRNVIYNNQIPNGILKQNGKVSKDFKYRKGGNNNFFDQSDRMWTLYPDDKNKFHQIDGFKTYKFTSLDSRGGSYEAILVTDPNEKYSLSSAKWLTTGPKQGTYNRIDNEINTIGHGYRDLLPHKYLGGNRYTNNFSHDVKYGTQTNNPTTTFKPRNLMGTSFTASSTPLTPIERKVWQRTKRRQEWSSHTPQFGSFGGGGGGGGGGSFDHLGGIGSSFRDMTPSNVGGVYLGGSGKMLDGIGLLEGVTLDANNNLILLSKTGDKINLPPLRLDDVVTIFRSVYIHGEGPTVTIDPSPVKPEESAMIVKHGKATENTYVGWVLYQADRLMKGYSLGADNITTEDISSSVPEYKDVLDTLYFGDDAPETYHEGGRWRRFWIVPSYVRRFNAANNDLTLVDVPLKLKTQVMKWENGELVDDPNGKSSAGATKFTEWFTRMYDSIAREQYLTPPPGSGITKPVPVFSELRRVALITALAEKLRDQGVVMPFWMRGYEVPKIYFDETTPALLMTRSNGNITAKVLGGVGLSPEDKVVKQFTQVSELKKLPEPEQKRAEKALVSATTLSNTVRKAVAQAKPLKIHKIPVKDDTYQALPVPGADTRALAPCQLEEVDMVVPIEGGHEIRLSRNYNSFFEPEGPWGKSWTLNLPWLERIRKPIKRKASEVLFMTEYELLTPFNSLYARFSEVKEVPALNNSQLQTPVKECDFFGLTDGSPTYLNIPTLKLMRKDGGAWHFTTDGKLVAIEKNGFRTVYLIDPNNGRLTQIAGLLGPQRLATIDLSYDGQGRLVKATGKSSRGEQEIEYEYGSDGKLSYVLSDQGKLGYRHNGPLVSSVTWQDPEGADGSTQSREKTIRSFEYNDNGQLVAETEEDGQQVAFNIASGHDGNTLALTKPGEKSASETFQYDEEYRPVKARYANGTQADWTYAENGKNVLDLKYPDGDNMRITESADKRRQAIEAPDMPVMTKEFDEAGRLTNVIENGQYVLNQTWHPNGYLKAVENDNCAAQPRYDEDGLTTSIVLTPPDEKEKATHWQETEMDYVGRPVKITDNRGLHIATSYDKDGNIKQVATIRDDKNYGYDIERDDEGRIETINSTWDKQQFSYDDNGIVEKIATYKTGQEDRKQISEFESGRLTRFKQFDGGEVAISYYDNKSPHEDLPQKVTCANGLDLDYQYDQSNNLEQVNIGDQSQVKLDYDTNGRIVAYTYRPAKD